VHVNAQPNVDDILLKQSSTSVKHIEGIVPNVGVIAIKGPDRQQVMDSGFAYQQKGLVSTVTHEGKDVPAAVGPVVECSG
jgi:hypothetical protein